MLSTEIEKHVCGKSTLRKPIGLRDGGHTIIKCSNCGKELVDVFITKPDAIDPLTGKKFVTKLIAKCCYCGDSSFITEVEGRFHLGGIGIPKIDDEEQCVKQTDVEIEDWDCDPVILNTKECING